MAQALDGRIIGGRYEVREALDRSRSITSYRATHLDLGHDVIVSLLDGGLGDDWAPAFRREMRVVGQLRHPNIVDVIDVGQTESGTPYVVRELAQGERLFRKLIHSNLRSKQTVEVLKAVAVALQYTHQFGVHHLAATPENIVLGETPSHPVARLDNFIAGRWRYIARGAPAVPDVRVGAPEVLGGAEPTPAADVYALGHLGYACLTGELPLSMHGESTAENAHTSPARWELPDDLEVAPGLREVIHRCLSKDPDARYRDCAELLDALERYEESAVETVRIKAVRSSGESYFPVPGTRFAGKFDVEDVRGIGGFARVFKARDAKSGRSLALKVLRPDRGANTATARRFVREGKLVFSYLSNPHTISVFDYGETEHGLLYIAFEFIDGRTLDEVLKEEGALSATRVVRILEQALASLSEAHGMGVLHRDIKPGNIMLSHRNGVEDWVTVLDFGVAKIASDVMETAELTMSGAAVGTPRYISPEQVVGDPVGPESDIYSLGLVVYELLTGVRAIEGESTFQIISNQLDPQSPILPRELMVPMSLQLLVNKMMRKERRSRYQDAHEVLADLRQLDRGVSGEQTVDTGNR